MIGAHTDQDAGQPSVGPAIVVLAGPNGAGKTTANADRITAGLSGLEPESVAIAAGRLMPARLNALAPRRVSFAFETRPASRVFAPTLATRGSVAGCFAAMDHVWRARKRSISCFDESVAIDRALMPAGAAAKLDYVGRGR
jgi:hypothetical protein